MALVIAHLGHDLQLGVALHLAAVQLRQGGRGRSTRLVLKPFLESALNAPDLLPHFLDLQQSIAELTSNPPHGNNRGVQLGVVVVRYSLYGPGNNLLLMLELQVRGVGVQQLLRAATAATTITITNIILLVIIIIIIIIIVVVAAFLTTTAGQHVNQVVQRADLGLIHVKN